MQTWRKYLAEFFGTLVLVGIGTGSILAALSTDTPLMAAVPLGFGLALMVGLYSVGEVSGGHFNPAVTFGAFLDGRTSLVDATGYWISQFAGAIVGSWFVAILVGRRLVAETATVPGVDTGQAFFGEVLFTAVFVILILSVTKGGFAKQAFMAISLGYAAIHFIGVPLTGASVNPARSLAPALLGEGGDNGDLWIYLTAPFLGALVGWIVYKVIVTGDTDFRDDMKRVGESVTS
ncbi:MAG: aquaporin [Acidimicrobiia bacterium]|nr:aquaporin [Acidimicrobiia bacterium]